MSGCDADAAEDDAAWGSDDADELRVMLRRERTELEALKKQSSEERDELEGRMHDIRQKTKDHIKQLQEKMQQVMKQKDAKLQELEEALAKAQSDNQSPPAEAESSLNSAADLAAAEARCATAEAKAAEALAAAEQLREQLRDMEGRLAGEVAAAREAKAAAAAAAAAKDAMAAAHAASDDGDVAASAAAAAAASAQLAAAAEEISALKQSLEDLKASSRQQQERLQADVAQAKEEAAKVRAETETKIAEVVRKAKDHVKQVQGRLETTVGENRELSEKVGQVEESYAQQQEKVAKYKQLMAQANARIEESDVTVRELREKLQQVQEQRACMQNQLDSHVAPSREDIAKAGGLSLAVETDDSDDIWCLVKSGGMAGGGRWWLLSQLDVDDKPVPLQRRWKGEVSALRAQMQRFKKKSEDIQEEFESYRQKATASLQINASQSEEMATKEREIERLGERLQSVTLIQQQTLSEKVKAIEELAEGRRKLQAVSSAKVDLESVLEMRAKEEEEKRERAIAACRQTFKAEKDALEQLWSEKERHYQKELDLRRAQKESLEEELEGLHGQLSRSRSDLQAAVAAAETAAAATAAAVSSSPSSTAVIGSITRAEDLRAGLSKASDRDHTRELSAPKAVASQFPSPRVESPTDGGTDAAGAENGDDGATRSMLPPQAYNLHASVAWEDLVNLRSQVRQLETTLQEEKERNTVKARETDALKAEVRDMTSRQRLQNTVGQQQQMEYIRNVFRKFVETLPMGGPEQEQLVPVLMTFFSFPDEDAKAIAAARQKKQATSKGFFGWR
eukprot:TRINITY_DN18737_c0_g1_i1.p1 TRINITY_DN18737_c0_g1~~TRINITY_DN18737_c0_g1_i1.p1  ORF type:complete len:796 (+),score=296.41 TRINITY_DN18737_c0_g1_i1:124-2511(+)